MPEPPLQSHVAPLRCDPCICGVGIPAWLQVWTRREHASGCTTKGGLRKSSAWMVPRFMVVSALSPAQAVSAIVIVVIVVAACAVLLLLFATATAAVFAAACCGCHCCCSCFLCCCHSEPSWKLGLQMGWGAVAGLICWSCSRPGRLSSRRSVLVVTDEGTSGTRSIALMSGWPKH